MVIFCHLLSFKNFLSVILFLFYCSQTFAQTFSISGKVTDIFHYPLPNVNIIISESGRGSTTNINVDFIIEDLSSGEYDLEFSFIGYESQTIKVVLRDKPEKINVVLKELPVETEQVIISASKYEQRISELPVSAEVLGSE